MNSTSRSTQVDWRPGVEHKPELISKWSNYGDCVDAWAPGVSITGTYSKDGRSILVISAGAY